MEFQVVRKCLLLFFLSSMYQHSIGQCPTNLANTVLREGDVHKFSQPPARRCTWKLIPANSFFNVVQKVASSDTGLSPAFDGPLKADESGLTIAKASTSPGKDKTWCPAGLLIMQDDDAKCNATAKVAVIKSGPTCQCNSSTKTTPAQYNCSLDFADSPVSLMKAQFTWISANEKDQVTDVPVPRKIDRLVYRSCSVFPIRVKGKIAAAPWTPKKCVVTFLAPAHGPFSNMARNIPTFTASCDFDSLKCNKAD